MRIEIKIKYHVYPYNTKGKDFNGMERNDSTAWITFGEMET